MPMPKLSATIAGSKLWVRKNVVPLASAMAGTATVRTAAPNSALRVFENLMVVNLTEQRDGALEGQARMRREAHRHHTEHQQSAHGRAALVGGAKRCCSERVGGSPTESPICTSPSRPV